MEQFFRFMLAFVIVIILGGVVAKYLDDNYSSFQIEETADKILEKKIAKKNRRKEERYGKKNFQK